jgi:hypothetical protein
VPARGSRRSARLTGTASDPHARACEARRNRRPAGKLGHAGKASSSSGRRGRPCGPSLAPTHPRLSTGGLDARPLARTGV